MKRGKAGIGPILMIAGVVLTLLGLSGVLGLASGDYWTRSKVETYRGYDIYYFQNANVYGIDTAGTNPPPPGDTWLFSAEIDSAKGRIDNLLDDAQYIEAYREWDIYREPGGAQRYWGVHSVTGQETSRWTSLSELKGYIDEIDPPDEPWESPQISSLTWAGVGLFAVGALMSISPRKLS